MSKSIFEKLFLEGWRPFGWIVGLIFVLYCKTLFFGYTHLDDNILILQNYSFLHDVGNLTKAFSQKVFTKSFLPYYRPLLLTSFIIDAQIGALSAFVYHFSNIIYHCIASSLVFVFLLRLGYKRMHSFFFAMIFAVHPVLSQGVAWIPGRNDTLLALFVLASFISLLYILRSGRIFYYLLHCFFFLAALFTKETALVLIVISLIYIYVVEKERLLSLRVIILSSGWAVCVIFWYCLRAIAVAGSLELSTYDIFSILSRYWPASIQFIGKIFLPLNLSVFPIIPDTTFIFGSLSLLFLALAVIITRSRRNDYIVFGISWAVLFLLPSLIRANYMISADFIEHRVYVPILGVFIILLETDLLKRTKRSAQVIAASVIITAFSVMTFIHIDNFKDMFTFWSNAVRTSPNSSFAHLARAQIFHESGHFGKAEEEYQKCIALDPLEPSSFYGLGEIYLKKGELAEAGRYFKKSIALYPFFDNAYSELGVVHYKEGRYDDALRSWKNALIINPNNVVTIKFLAIYYYEAGNYKEARRYSEQLEKLGLKPPEDFIRKLNERDRRE